MEKNFYNDNFELLLKDTTDDFRMYPSKRVWHSLYNDLHPGKRWPSLAVCLLLISSVLYIGISNNNSINSISRRIAAENILASTRLGSGNNNDPSAQNRLAINNQVVPLNVSKPVRAKDRPTESSTNSADFTTVYIDAVIPNFENTSSTPIAPVVTINDPSILLSNSFEAGKMIKAIPYKVFNSSPASVIIHNDLAIPTIIQTQEIDVVKQVLAKTLNTPGVNMKADLKNNKEELAWIEDYALHNKSFARKWRTKRSIQYYITPSIGYRQLNKNTSYEPASTLIVSNPGINRNINDILSQNAAINLEAGTVVLFDLSKSFRLKTGVQFNYTNYITNAFELKHPTQTTLLLNDMRNGYLMLAPYNSIYANTAGISPKKLNNKTIQISIPVGADFKLAGRNKLKWYAGATIQPTLVASGNAYLISSDAKNYINEESMLRKWNINGGIETFISYKTNSGISINAGPQFRYQFLSTYSKQYTYTEKLYNFGLKMGITRSF